MSVPPHPVLSLEPLVNRRRGHKPELPPSHDSILSIPEKFLPQQMRAKAELSLQVRWGNQDRKRLRPSFYTALFFQELQYRTVTERSAHLTRCEQFAECLFHFRERGNFPSMFAIFAWAYSQTSSQGAEEFLLSSRSSLISLSEKSKLLGAPDKSDPTKNVFGIKPVTRIFSYRGRKQSLALIKIGSFPHLRLRAGLPFRWIVIDTTMVHAVESKSCTILQSQDIDCP
jgi:hypothetical protein